MNTVGNYTDALANIDTLRKMVNTKFDVLSDVERTMIKRVRLQAEEACRANLVDAIHRNDREAIEHYTTQLLGL